MAVYLVTWNLNKERPNYDQARRALIAEIERYDNVKDPGLESVRFVSTTASAQAVSDSLKKKLDDNDRLFVARLTSGQHQGWLDKAVWAWINQRL